MTNKLGAMCAILLSGLLLGCATMLKGTKEEIMVASDPSGANVSINGQTEGTTPYENKVPSSENLHVEVSKPGYEPVSIEDDADFRWGYEIWSFVAYIIPLGVDMADGAAWGHDKTMLSAHLTPVSQAAAASTVASAPTPGASSSPSPARPQ